MEDSKMYEIMREVERRIDARGYPKNMVNTVLFLNEMGCLKEPAKKQTIQAERPRCGVFEDCDTCDGPVSHCDLV